MSTTIHKPVKRGIFACGLCGYHFRPAGRSVPHPDGAVCRARQVCIAYAERGWGPCADATQGKMLQEIGVPVEVAFGLSQNVECAETDATQAVTRTWREDRQFECYFAPRDAIRAAHFLRSHRIDKKERRQFIQIMVLKPALLETVAVIQRLAQPDEVSRKTVLALRSALKPG